MNGKWAAYRIQIEMSNGELLSYHGDRFYLHAKFLKNISRYPYSIINQNTSDAS
jgi:hypothetical protein